MVWDTLRFPTAFAPSGRLGFDSGSRRGPDGRIRSEVRALRYAGRNEAAHRLLRAADGKHLDVSERRPGTRSFGGESVCPCSPARPVTSGLPRTRISKGSCRNCSRRQARTSCGGVLRSMGPPWRTPIRDPSPTHRRAREGRPRIKRTHDQQFDAILEARFRLRKAARMGIPLSGTDSATLAGTSAEREP
jgi:hypothetical protein